MVSIDFSTYEYFWIKKKFLGIHEIGINNDAFN